MVIRCVECVKLHRLIRPRASDVIGSSTRPSVMLHECAHFVCNLLECFSRDDGMERRTSNVSHLGSVIGMHTSCAEFSGFSAWFLNGNKIVLWLTASTDLPKINRLLEFRGIFSKSIFHFISSFFHVVEWIERTFLYVRVAMNCIFTSKSIHPTRCGVVAYSTKNASSNERTAARTRDDGKTWRGTENPLDI